MTAHRPDLIYDVGMHTGEDTAYYLHKGYSVVAVEANPDLVRAARYRFGAAMAAGRLTIVEAGIAAARGQAEFFVSTRRGVWSSFDRANAAKDGSGVVPVRVPTLPFRDVLREHGVPYYLKVDIEGSDRLCLQDLEAGRCPAFVSIEMSENSGLEDIGLLAALDYTRSHCIRQNDFSPIGPADLAGLVHERRRAARFGPAGTIPRRLRGILRRLRPPRDGGWVFPRGASGRFGNDVPGPWLALEEIENVWTTLHRLAEDYGDAGRGDWFDIHATGSP